VRGGGGGEGPREVIITICVFFIMFLAHFWDTTTVAIMCIEEFAKKTHFKF